MAHADDYLEYFRRVPMFSTCSKKDLKTVAANAERVDVPAGRILCEQGQTGREAFVIVDGKARGAPERTQGRDHRSGYHLR